MPGIQPSPLYGSSICLLPLPTYSTHIDTFSFTVKQLLQGKKKSRIKDLSVEWGNGTPLQYSCLEKTTDGGAWWAAHGVAEGRTRLSDLTFTHRRRKRQPTPVFLPGESQGRGSLVGCHLWGHTESDTTEAT